MNSKSNSVRASDAKPESQSNASNEPKHSSSNQNAPAALEIPQQDDTLSLNVSPRQQTLVTAVYTPLTVSTPRSQLSSRIASPVSSARSSCQCRSHSLAPMSPYVFVTYPSNPNTPRKAESGNCAVAPLVHYNSQPGSGSCRDSPAVSSSFSASVTPRNQFTHDCSCSHSEVMTDDTESLPSFVSTPQSRFTSVISSPVSAAAAAAASPSSLPPLPARTPVRIKHDYADERKDDGISPSSSTPSSYRQLWGCDVCGAEFASGNSYEHHMNTHNNDLYYCWICFQSARQSYVLTNHNCNFGTRMIRCPNEACLFRGANAAELNSHRCSRNSHLVLMPDTGARVTAAQVAANQAKYTYTLSSSAIAAANAELTHLAADQVNTNAEKSRLSRIG